MASNNIARMGVVLGLDTAEFTAAIDKAIGENRKLGAAIKKDMNAAAAEIVQLKYATEDYGKTLTKVQLIEREIQAGRYQNATSEMKDILLQQAAAYDAVANSAKKATTGMTEWQKQGLMYQTTDFVTQVASGQNVMIAALQQGGQLKDQMGGLVPMFQMLAGVIFTVTGAAVAAAAALGTIGAAAYLGRKEFDALQKSIALTGNYAQVSTGEYDLMAQSLEAATKVTISGAKDIMAAMLSSGQFTKDTFNSVGQVIAKYSELSDLTAKEAASKLIPSLDGTASGAKRLNDQYNFLTLAQYKQIEILEKQGKKQEAIRLEADLLTESWKKQTIELGYIDQALNTSAKAWDDFWASVFNWGKPDAVAEQIRKIQLEINNLAQQGPPKQTTSWGGDDKAIKEAYDARLAALEKQKSDLVSRLADTQKDAEKMSGQKEAINSYAKDLGIDKQRELQKQIADMERDIKYEALLRGADDEQRIALGSKKAQEKINADFLTDVKDKDYGYWLFRKELRDKQIALEIAKEKTQYADYNKQKQEETTKWSDDYARQLAEASKKAAEDEVEASEKAVKYFEDLRDKAHENYLERKAKELDEDIKNTAEAVKVFDDFARRIAENDAKGRDESTAKYLELKKQQDDYYDKAKETNDLEKEKIFMQIKMIGASNERIKLAQLEIDYQKELKDIQDKTWMTEQDILEAQQRALEKRQGSEELVKMQGHLKDLQETNDVVWKDMSSAIDEMVEKGETSFAKLTQSIINDLMKIYLKRQMMDLMDSVKGGASNLGGLTGIGASIGNFFGIGNKAGVGAGTLGDFPMMGIDTAATGGPIDGLTLVGEKGPELFMPNGAGTIIPNDKLGDMGGGQTVNYNGPYIAQMSAIDTQSGLQFLAKNKQGVWASYQSANRSIPMSR
ncbi:Bacteriophage lambda, GpH, tail tape measure, C-terminal [uncultured Caudovirales phage]|uniref:Bacteriophage lambda, GpH, tail tape measure, C-terminal n=1 Tax=uncultured Caudovirales phage TaxID=2100421 RepID=A0A6J5KLX7_9CAUD|nr:Bacteriophage lambda, GpH, tail tape measure, C-terminal [uncultured Caudovirales phage]